MTPKEKAGDLYDKYLWLQRKLDDLACPKYAKECSIIAVDEIINELFDGRQKATKSNNERIKYWQEVKQEIDKI